MSFTDYILDSALVLLVLLQIKEKPLSTKSLIRPFVIVGVAVASYFNSVPTAGNDLVLIAVLGLFGLLLGVSAGQATHMRRREDGAVTARAGWAAVVLWVLGMGLRFVFLIWINSAGGAAHLASFSVAHSITGAAAWTDALLAMAVFEVVGRTALLATRRRMLRARGAVAAHIA